MSTTSWRILIASVCATALASSCMPLTERMLTRVEARVARDQMMYVRVQPPTFGYQRLITLMDEFPDMGTFANQRGLPDFLAETGDQDQRYMILYYLPIRQAFACRTLSRRSNSLEFAGPYPITDSEFKTLDGIRQRAVAP